MHTVYCASERHTLIKKKKKNSENRKEAFTPDFDAPGIDTKKSQTECGESLKQNSIYVVTQLNKPRCQLKWLCF